MLRTVAVLMCALLCALWGVKSSLSLKIRRDMLCAVTEGVERLSVGMEHTNRPLATLLYGCGHGRAQPLFSAVADNLLCGMGGADAWTEAIGRMPTGLTEEDIAILTDFSLTLGQSTDGCSAAIPRWRWQACALPAPRPRMPMPPRGAYTAPWARCWARAWRYCYGRRYGVMEVEMLFKIAGVGIVAAIVTQMLKQSGRDEMATIAAIAGLIIGLMMMLDMVEELFTNVRAVFNLY